MVCAAGRRSSLRPGEPHGVVLHTAVGRIAEPAQRTDQNDGAQYIHPQATWYLRRALSSRDVGANDGRGLGRMLIFPWVSMPPTMATTAQLGKSLGLGPGIHAAHRRVHIAQPIVAYIDGTLRLSAPPRPSRRGGEGLAMQVELG